MSAVDVVRVGERAIRLAIPDRAPRSAMLAWLLDQPDVVDASLAAEHALVVFAHAPRPIVLPELDPDATTHPIEHVIEVVYDGDDLDEIAALASLTRDEV